MTKDEALKMAIEQIQHLIEVYMPSPEWTGTAIQKECYEVLNACKEALERPSNMVAVPLDKLQDMQRRLKALEQPAQEPVAWMYNGNLHEFNPSDWATEPVTPLYPHPHQWQGLTDDEISQLFVGHTAIDFARAIEQALKEKNT